MTHPARMQIEHLGDHWLVRLHYQWKGETSLSICVQIDVNTSITVPQLERMALEQVEQRIAALKSAL